VSPPPAVAAALGARLGEEGVARRKSLAPRRRQVLSGLADLGGAMRVKVISRSTDDYTRERSQDLQVGVPYRDSDSCPC